MRELDDSAAEVAAEHRRLLIEHGRQALPATAVALLVLGANALVDVASGLEIALCSAVGVALVGAHLAIVLADRRSGPDDRIWSAWPLAILHGVAWALIVALLWPATRDEQLLYLVFIVAWSAVVALASAPFVGHASVVIVPPAAVTVIAFIAAGTPECVAIAAGLTLYVGALIVLQARASRTLLRAVRLQIEHDARSRQLNTLALTDPLTGVGNRRALVARLQEEQERDDATPPSSLAVLDLDRFKEVNDRLGHNAGDEVLARFARILTDETGPDAVVARTGGEEFAVVLTGMAASAAVHRLDEVRRTVAREFRALDRPVTVSIGVHVLQRGETVAQSLESADIALYRAKRNGRNCVVTST